MRAGRGPLVLNSLVTSALLLGAPSAVGGQRAREEPAGAAARPAAPLREVETETTLARYGAVALGAGLALAWAWHSARLKRRKRRDAEAERSRDASVEEISRLTESVSWLEGENARLLEAKELLTSILELPPGSSGDLAGRVSATGTEIARFLGGSALHLFTREGREAVLFAGDEASAPEATLVGTLLDDLDPVWLGGRLFVPVSTLSGDSAGIVVVSGLTERPDEDARRLVSAFARQVGMLLAVDAVQRHAPGGSTGSLPGPEGADAPQPVRLCPKCGRCVPPSEATCPFHETTVETLPEVLATIAGRYDLEKKIGAGGAGFVFRALDTGLFRKVAIKLIRPARFASDTSRRSYQDEARLLAQLQHPAVVSLFDSGELPGGVVYLVLELLAGKDLETTLRGLGPAAPDQVSAFLGQVGDALSRAHEKGLLHRDIKPANVFVLDGQPLCFKLLDFGLARDAFTPSQTGENVVGTPRYIAPELFRNGAPSPRSDLYGLAATAYEMLTATPVVRSETFADLTLEILYERAPRLSETFPDVPARIETAFERALSKDPEERPATVSEWLDSFLGDLERMPPVRGLGRWPASRAGGG